ncbi:MAG: DUF401 family protein [Pseudomonadota bacterium]
MPALLTILGVLALIVLLARLRLPLALAILGGSLVLCGIEGQGVAGTLAILGHGLVRDRTLGLVLVTVLQVLLIGVLEVGGQTQRIVALARALLRRPAVSMAVLPALIGLLPMPGGALFSAPMVGEAAGDEGASPARLSAINYWYRHIWEHWWPIYPGVILAVALVGRSWPAIALAQAPLGLCMVLGGLPLLLGLPAATRVPGPPAERGTVGRLLLAVAPVSTIVVAVVVLSPLAARIPAGALPVALAHGVRQIGPIATGLTLALGVAWAQSRVPARALLPILRRKELRTLPLLVATVMVFQAALDQLGLAPRIAAELDTHHIPVLGVIVALPYLAGAATGLAVGFVGTSFPIVLPLAATLAGDGGSILPYAAMAYAFGHLGQLSSPIHLCMVVSNRWFGVGYGPVYRLLVPSLLLTALISGTYLAVLALT